MLCVVANSFELILKVTLFKSFCIDARRFKYHIYYVYRVAYYDVYVITDNSNCIMCSKLGTVLKVFRTIADNLYFFVSSTQTLDKYVVYVLKRMRL